MLGINRTFRGPTVGVERAYRLADVEDGDVARPGEQRSDPETLAAVLAAASAGEHDRVTAIQSDTPHTQLLGRNTVHAVIVDVTITDPEAARWRVQRFPTR
jgi:hypothetical protein